MEMCTSQRHNTANNSAFALCVNEYKRSVWLLLLLVIFFMLLSDSYVCLGCKWIEICKENGELFIDCPSPQSIMKFIYTIKQNCEMSRENLGGTEEEKKQIT